MKTPEQKPQASARLTYCKAYHTKSFYKDGTAIYPPFKLLKGMSETQICMTKNPDAWFDFLDGFGCWGHMMSNVRFRCSLDSVRASDLLKEAEITCDDCDGSRFVTSYAHNGYIGHDFKEACPKCEGTGKVWIHRDNCPNFTKLTEAEIYGNNDYIDRDAQKRKRQNSESHSPGIGTDD